MKYSKWVMICLVLGLSCLCHTVKSQDGGFSIPSREKRYHVKNLNYVDFIFFNQKIWAISEDGQLIIWDIANDQPGTEQYEFKNVTSITKTQTGEIYLGTQDGEILKYHLLKKRWDIVYSIHTPVYGICIFDAAKHYAITDHGLVNVIAETLHRPQYSMNSAMDYSKSTIGIPSSILCDSRQQVWFTYYQGEWGGDIHVFSPQNEAYLPLKIDYEKIIEEPLPVKKIPSISSVVEGTNHTVYVTSGVQHLGVDRSGSIIEFHKVFSIIDTFKRLLKPSTPVYIGTPIFLSSTHRPSVPYIDPSGEYIGPSYFNPYDHKLYYYSNYGFHVVEYSGQGHKLIRKKLFHPKLKWIYGRRMNGSNLSVLKFEFIDEHTIVFLTRFDGISIFDGEIIKFYK